MAEVKFSVALVLLLAFIGLLGFGVRYVDRQMAEQHAENEERLLAQQVNAVETRYSAAIEFYDMDGTDEKLARLKPLPYLYLVSFHQTAVSATGLRYLASQPNLKAIAFDTAAVSDADMEAVAELPHLESLVLRQTPVSDVGIRTATAISTLQHLKLSCASNIQPYPMTDGTLVALANCPQLRELTLEGNWFSDDAVERLRNALPDCRIDVERFEIRPR